MKKIFTLMAVAVMALAVNAKDYNDKLVLDISLGGSTSDPVEQQSTISVDEVENSDGLYNITLNDFSFGEMKLGNIKIVNVKGNSDTDGFVTFEKNEQTVKVNLFGKEQNANVILNEGSRMKGDKLYLNLDITAMGVVKVHAVFGDNNFTTTGIDKVTTTTDNGVESIYDLNGRKLNEMQKGINIVRKADGTTVKVLKK